MHNSYPGYQQNAILALTSLRFPSSDVQQVQTCARPPRHQAQGWGSAQTASQESDWRQTGILHPQTDPNTEEPESQNSGFYYI